MIEKKVMLIDDEKDFRLLVKINLERTGKYDVLALPSAKDILSQVYNFKPDIILIDIIMPEVGGLDACEILSKDPLAKNIPILILSVLDKDIDKERAYKTGIVDYLTKPVELEQLLAKIQNILKC